MGIIAYDPSESRENTRLPQDVIKAGRALNGLEAATGADILVSPLAMPLLELSEPRGFDLLRRHAMAGVLIQRKSGRDAVSSIPKYDEILYRMLEWTTRPYLVCIGVYTSNKEGYVQVDGQTTNWKYNAFISALDWWQLTGTRTGVSGRVTMLSRDGQLLPYLKLWLDRVQDEKWNDIFEHRVGARLPSRTLAQADWVSVVMGLGIGFGGEKVKWLEDSFEGFADFLECFSNPENINMEMVKRANGIGKSQFVKVRRLLGLSKDEILVRHNTTQDDTLMDGVENE